MNDLKLLPPPEKKVVAKELLKAGYSTRTIEDWIGADHTTISRWALQDTPDDMQRYATDFAKQIEAEKKKGVALGLRRLNELIPKERKIPDLVKGLEFLEGRTESKNLTQINVSGEKGNTINFVNFKNEPKG